MPQLSPEFTVKYFPEYGIHSIPNGDSVDHLVSFPTWEETELALKNNMPTSGRIITPEYITTPHDISHISESTELIRERINMMKDLSLQTDAEIYLGTPYQRPVRTAVGGYRQAWQNSVLHINQGNLTGITSKEVILPVEEKFGIEQAPRNRERIIRNGRAVLICAELYSYPDRPSINFTHNVKEVIAPTMWATPVDGVNDPHTTKMIKEAGGPSNYYRKMLERTIGTVTLAKLPNVDRVTTVDRGTPDTPPYNAVFERVKK